MGYREIETSREVVAVLMARHREDIVPFSSFSDPDGTFHCGHGIPTMETWYGFKKSGCPLYHAKTTWEIDSNGDRHVRKNEKHEYWICVPCESDED